MYWRRVSGATEDQEIWWGQAYVVRKIFLPEGGGISHKVVPTLENFFHVYLLRVLQKYARNRNFMMAF